MRFDASLKWFFDVGPLDWPRLLGDKPTRVEVVDSDISTVSGATDKVLRIVGPPDWILHLEFQAGPDAGKPSKLNVYNSLLEDRFGLPVRTVFVLLRPDAYLRAYTGKYTRICPPEEKPYRQFHYRVLKIWEMEPKSFLSGLATLPLAPLAKVKPEELPHLMKEIQSRVERKAPKSLVDQIWTATYVLLGLRYNRALAKELLRGVPGMKESVTYQAILQEGEELGGLRVARSVLLGLGRRRFHAPPSKRILGRISQIHDVDKLQSMSWLVLEAKSWEELLEQSAKED